VSGSYGSFHQGEARSLVRDVTEQDLREWMLNIIGTRISAKKNVFTLKNVHN